MVQQRFDFDVSLSFQPIILYYQLVPVNKLMDFLKVADFKEELKLQATEKFESFKQSVNLSEIIHVRQKNRLQINIASPILVIPFKKNNDVQSECWVINMGTFSLVNYESEEGLTDSFTLNLRQFKNFRISIKDIMLGYTPSMKGWVDGKLKPTAVIERFGYEFIMSLPIEGGATDSAKQLHMHGKMSDLEISFTPHTYCNLININQLLLMQEGETVENLVVNDKALILKMSSKIGVLKVHDPSQVELQ